jgi:GT2 family glycosyltransferase
VKTTVLIVNYNAGPLLGACLASLRASDAAGLPVLVVDNASRDASSDAVARDFPEVEVLQLPQNVGFAAGVNAGLAHLAPRGPQRILLLNPDTRVAPRFLAPLVRALDAGAAIAGPKILDEERRIWCAGGKVTFGLNMARLGGHRQRDRGQWDRPRDVSFLPATAWLLAPQALERIGAFDESFFCYLEDVDYCVRAASLGLSLRYEPESVVVHVGSQASGGGYTRLRKYLNAHGSFRLLHKHGTLRRWATFLACDVLTAPLALLYGLFRGKPAAALWKVRGLVDGGLRRPVTRERRERLISGARP